VKEGHRNYCSRDCFYKDVVAYTSRKCLLCGREFKVHAYRGEDKSRGKYCSTACFLASRPRKITLNCMNCGKEFKVSPYRLKKSRVRFCSRECRVMKVTIKCLVCGKRIIGRPSELRNKKFCSHKCKGKANLMGEITNCDICGKEFYVRKYMKNKSKKNYCSNECKHKAKENKITLICPVCKRQFTTVSYRLKEGRKYCSQRCYKNSTEPTTIELELYEFLTAVKIDYVPQFQIGPYTVDAYIPCQKLAIEADGKYWHNLKSSIVRDKAKNSYLTRHGYNLLRLSEGSFITGSYKSILSTSLFHSIKPENLEYKDSISMNYQDFNVFIAEV
jgi:very-short-patch-repair endonuclease